MGVHFIMPLPVIGLITGEPESNKSALMESNGASLLSSEQISAVLLYPLMKKASILEAREVLSGNLTRSMAIGQHQRYGCNSPLDFIILCQRVVALITWAVMELVATKKITAATIFVR